VLSGLHVAGLPDFVVPDSTGGLGRALLAALTFHVNVLEARRGYLPANWDVLWSLSVEEVFYLAFPLLCRGVGRVKLLGRCGLLTSLLVVLVALGPAGRTVIAHGNEVWQEYSYLGGMDAIALGCLTALALPRLPTNRLLLRAIGTVGITLLALPIGNSDPLQAWGLGRAGLDMTFVGLGACLTMAATARSGWQSPRVLRPGLRLGRHSYEIYLTHMFVVFALFDAFLSAGKPPHAVPLLFVGVIVLAAILGAGVAHGFSEPLNRRLRESRARRRADGR
jgi:peptidoglycan/LPS O-acetylase OafA/YrhL